MRFLSLFFTFALLPILGFSANQTFNDAGAKLVLKTTQGKAKITQEFKALGDINGYVVEPTTGGQSLVVYANKDGKFMMVGNLINGKGKSLTEGFMDKYVTSKVAANSYAEAQHMYYFSDGSNKAPHKAYIIIDPNCIFCHKLYTAIIPLIDKGQVQVRWIPAGFLKPSSVGKAAALLNAKSDKEAVALLHQDEMKFNTGQELGGLKAIEKNSQNSTAFDHVTANTQFFGKYGFQGTPTFIYKDAKGKAHFFPGYVAGDQLQKLIETMSSTW